ncbi:surface lipoprotein assembly modifier [Testudinibacter aquarius]|uniref:Tetratricopeptide repeat protein n=2 Tax=Testudinibacter aquarius TaxID=1524974 RepID=A0A4R3XZ21_9PAST|nr:surface lipoprotein assembly modifier [Testudinibacter aquarius]TCV82943.1 tetratricopeptide repeat protein [Testudinibacter aquarius]
MRINHQFLVSMAMLPIFSGLFGGIVQAQTVTTEQAPRLGLDESKFQVAQPQLPQPTLQAPSAVSQPKSISISKEELAKYPELVLRALLPALMQNNAEGVALLLPIYQAQGKTDPMLVMWGEAILAQQQQDYARALSLYRTLFAKNPNLIPVRYQMAQVLYLNNDNEAARDQFEKLRTENVSPAFVQLIDRYLTAINRRDQWTFQGGLSYLNEANVNNAPKAGTEVNGWKAWQSEKAEGIGYNLGADKKWSLQHGFFSKVSLSGYGRYYWDNKKYNEFNARISAGLGYQTARSEVTLMPFTERRWYGGGASGSDALKRFSQNSGLRLDFSYWLAPRWQISTALEYGEQRYVTRKHLNGNNYFWSNTLLYMPSSDQYWVVGVDYSRDNARHKDNAYQRKNIRLGWGQEWMGGISTRITLNYAKRQYKAADFTGIRQKNDEYGAQFSIWHRNLHFWGITPRVTWAYTKIDSNNPFYSYDKNRLYLEVSKRF